MEHKGQVMLYSMMMSDRRLDPECGLLLYLRDASMQQISTKQQEMKGIYLCEYFQNRDSSVFTVKLPGTFTVNLEYKGHLVIERFWSIYAISLTTEEMCIDFHY